MEQVFFTADQHFGHRNIIRMANRPFSTVEEMHRTIIDNWNKTVSSEDTIFVLGDFIGKEHMDEKDSIAIGEALNGHKILIKGNHDRNYPMKTIFDKVYEAKHIHELQYEGVTFRLNHFLNNMTIEGDLPSVIYLHAHKHNHIGYNVINSYYRRPLYDVGVDANRFTPVPLNKIIEFFENPPQNPPRIRCKKCGALLVERDSMYGRFLGCSNYLQCSFVESLEIDRRTAIEKDEYRSRLKEQKQHT